MLRKQSKPKKLCFCNFSRINEDKWAFEFTVRMPILILHNITIKKDLCTDFN